MVANAVSLLYISAWSSGLDVVMGALTTRG
jgi:hypothetical protein